MKRQASVNDQTFTAITDRPAPQRITNPRSHWRDLICGMRPGHWFEVPKSSMARMQSAAQKYARGRYSLYRHPTKTGNYVFIILK